MEQAIQGPRLYQLSSTGPGGRSAYPPVREVSRPHLVERVERGVAGRLVLLVAPAGWGKSSLLAEWARSTGRPVAWVDCQRYGDSGHRLMKGIVAALETVCPDFGRDLFAMLRSARPLPTSQLFSVLADALEDFGDDVALVLDDFQAVREDELARAIFELASSGPRNLHVVVASRMVPAWPLARMRVAGDLEEIGARDLAFSVDDVDALLGHESISRDVARALHGRTAGWPAGARLAKLWVRGNATLDDCAAVLEGSQRNFADYLAEEVMAQLSPHVRRFLYATALPERFSAGLANAMLGDGDVTCLMETVERHDLFLVPDDAAGQWYRYHDVFRDFLRSRAVHELGATREEMLARACRWLQDHGYALEATRCYLQIGRVDDAATILDACAEHLVLRDGESAALIDLAEQMPSEAVASHLRLQRFYTWALVLVGRLDDAERIAQDLDRRSLSMAPEAQRFARAEAASIRSRIAAYRGDHDATIAFGLAALDCGDEASDWFRADALLSLGFAYRATGRLAEACDAFGQASALGWRTRFANAALWGSRYQALTLVSLGQLEDAWAQIERDVGRAEQAGMTHGAAYAALLVTRGELRYERNHLGDARADLTAALRLARAAGDAKILMNVHVALAMLEAAEGNMDAARDAIRTAVRVFDGTSEKAVEVRLALREGDIARARRWMEAYVASVSDRPSFRHGETEQLTLARVLIATGEAVRAGVFLTELLREAEATDRQGTELVIRALLAQVEEVGDQREQAEDDARRVIDLAMRERFVRSLIDEGRRFLEVLRRATRHDPSPARRDYARAVLGMAESSDVPRWSPEADGQLDPLTPRQHEVLGLMMDGMSNREIADALFLAEGTVKAHMNQIFTKLMVRNRAEAIRAAQRMGIAP